MGQVNAKLLAALLAAALLAGCGGGDASAEEAEQHDHQQTIQPVACAASGCAR